MHSLSSEVVTSLHFTSTLYAHFAFTQQLFSCPSWTHHAVCPEMQSLQTREKGCLACGGGGQGWPEGLIQPVL